MRTRLLFLSFLFLSLFGLSAQDRLSDLKIRQYTTADGLPENSVRSLHQDSRGFIWMGLAEGGVCRFDGHSFKQIVCNDGASAIGTDAHVINILEDGQGHLWIETFFSGVGCYDVDKEKFIDYNERSADALYRIALCFDNETWVYNKSEGGAMRVRIDKDGVAQSKAFSAANGSLPSDRIFYIHQNPSGDVFIGTRDGLSRIRGEEATILDSSSFFVASCSVGGVDWHIDDKGSIYQSNDKGELIWKAQLTANNELVAGAIAGKEHWFVFAQRNSYLFRFEDCSIRRMSAAEQIGAATLSGDPEGTMYAYNRAGKVFSYDKRKDKVSVFETNLDKQSEKRFRFAKTNSGDILVATNGNGLIINSHAEGSIHTMDLASMLRDPQGNFILDILCDRDNHIWLATRYSGLLKLTPIEDGVKFVKVAEQDDGVGNMIKMIRQIDNELWVSSADGNFRYFSLELEQRNRHLSAPKNAYCAIEASDGSRVIGTNGEGLYIGDKHYQYRRRDNDGISGNKVFDVILDNSGRIWIALLDGGLNLAVKGEDGEYRFRHFFNDNFPTPSFRTLAKDSEGRIWAGSNRGVIVFNPEEMIEDKTSFEELNTRNGSLLSDQIITFLCDSKGRMWIGESGSGVCLAIRDHKGELNLKHYSILDGLVNSRVRDLEEDLSGDIWITTEDGISCLNPESESFTNYHFSNKNQGNTNNFGAAVRLDSGEIISGTNDGLLVIQPAELKRLSQEKNDSLIFTSFELANNSLRAEFSAMDFDDDTQYSYMLEGYDKDWSPTSRNNSVYYSKLPPGNYKLKVKATSNNLSETSITKGVEIKPHFLLSVYAVIIYLVVIIVVFSLIFKLRRENIELKARVDEDDKVRSIISNQIKEGNRSEFTSRMSRIMSKNISNAAFSVDDFASEMAMSRSAFYAKVNEVTGGSPNKYMRTFRLKKAADLLLYNKNTIEEIAYMCGFSDASYFSRLFKAEFGLTPKAYKSRATK